MSGSSMRSAHPAGAFICAAMFVVGGLALEACDSPALGQGSTGGSIGKQDKSISGDLDRDSKGLRSNIEKSKPVVRVRKNAQKRVEPTQRPHTETTRSSSSDSNGTWSITWTTRSGSCRPGESGTYAIGAQNGVIRSKSGGSVSSSGAARWGTVNRRGQSVSYAGVLRGNSGSGSWRNSGGCQGTFVARKS
jgi:hypothetical protein